MKPAVGDSFIINTRAWTRTQSTHYKKKNSQRCVYSKKKFIIAKMEETWSGVTIYFKDTRSFIKCTCGFCRSLSNHQNNRKRIYDPVAKEYSGYARQPKEFETVSIDYIIVTDKRLHRERTRSLLKLLGKKPRKDTNSTALCRLFSNILASSSLNTNLKGSLTSTSISSSDISIS